MTALKDSTAIVFGGASGLGKAVSRKLSADGAHVVVADINHEQAASVAESVGGTAVIADVTDPESVQAAVASASGLRVSVNCAGIGTPGKLLKRGEPTPLDHFASVIDVNLIGTINVLRTVAAAMGQNEPDADGERGVCVNTASIAAYDGQIGQIAYAASKAGVVGVTLPAARELAAQATRVVTIAPGLFDTPLLAGLPEAARESLGQSVPYPQRLGNPSEFAELVAHIVTNRMLNGEVIRLDGALRMGPH